MAVVCHVENRFIDHNFAADCLISLKFWKITQK